MELLTKKYVYQIVGESTVGSNECIIKSEALSLASKNRKNVTSDLSAYSSNEYIDKFEVEDMPDLRKFKFAKTAFQFGEAGGNGTSAVVSTDIDGNDIAFTALANVDWVNVTKAKDNTVEFTVNNNTGNMRSAKITGTNSTGFTDTISIQQDAYTPQYSHTYTLRINGAASQPTKVVINNQEVTPVKQGSSYICTYTYRSSNTDDAPSKVSYSIAGGLKAQEVISTDSSVSPLSWNLDNGLTKSFAVSVVNTVRSYSWDYQSGVDNFINIDSEDVVEMKSADSTQSTSASYTVNPPTGVTVTRNGMNFTATASSTSSTGIMQVVVNGKAYNIKVTYDPAIIEKTYTYTLKATGASSAPKMTINNQSITPTYASGVYTGVYSTTCPEGSQPSTVTWSISDGVPSTDWGQYYISTSPSSWSVTGAGSKDFSVSISQDKTEYSWSATSGTIAYNDSASCRIVSEDGTWTPSSDNIKVSVDSPSWVSTSMNGKTLTATTDGSETSDRSGNIRLTTAYSDGTQGTCYISVSYTAPTIEETWSDWTYTFGAKGEDGKLYDSAEAKYDVDGNKTSKDIEIVSYKTRISSLGNTQKEDVGYTGEIWAPSGANTTSSEIRHEGAFVQNESRKSIFWSATQARGEETWSDWTYTFGFDAGNLILNSKTDYWTAAGIHSHGTGGSVLSYKERTSNFGSVDKVNVNYTGDEIWLPSGANTSTSDIVKTGTFTQDESGKTISWTVTQYGVEETWPDWSDSSVVYTFKSSVALDFTFSYDCHSVDYVNYTIRSYKTRTSNLGNTEDQTVNYTGDSIWIPSSNNTSEEAIVKTGTFTQDESGKTIPWTVTQEGKPHETVTTGPYYDNFSATSVNFSYTGGSKIITCTKYYLVDGVRSNETTESKTITCSENTSTSSKSWTETFNGLTISCTQDGAPEPVITGPYYKDFSATSLTFAAKGGSQNIIYTKYYLKDGVEYNSSRETYTISCSENDSYDEKTWTETVGDKTITCTLAGKEKITYNFFYMNKPLNGDQVSGPKTFTYDYKGNLTAENSIYIESSKSDGTSVSYSGGPSSPGENTSTESKTFSGYYTQAESGYTLAWTATQDGKPATTGPFYKDITPTSLIFPPEGGSLTVTGKEYYLDGDMLEINERAVSKTYTCDANDTDSIKTWFVDFYGTSIECKQSAKAVEPETVNVSVSGSASMEFSTGSLNVGVNAYSGRMTISPTVPFDVTVTAFVTTTAQNNAGLLNNTETVTISANKGSQLFSGTYNTGLADGGASCTVTINRISPSSKTVNDVKYVLS